MERVSERNSQSLTTSGTALCAALASITVHAASSSFHWLSFYWLSVAARAVRVSASGVSTAAPAVGAPGAQRPGVASACARRRILLT